MMVQACKRGKVFKSEIRVHSASPVLSHPPPPAPPALLPAAGMYLHHWWYFLVALGPKTMSFTSIVLSEVEQTSENNSPSFVCLKNECFSLETLLFIYYLKLKDNGEPSYIHKHFECWTDDTASWGYWDNFFSRHSRRRICYYGKLITPSEVKNSMEVIVLGFKKQNMRRQWWGLAVEIKWDSIMTVLSHFSMRLDTGTENV